MPGRDELKTIFEDARLHLKSLPDWKITSETRREIARLSATAVGGPGSSHGRESSNPMPHRDRKK